MVENRFLLTFDHIPDAVEFCRELIKDDEFERMLRSMRPWGEEDCLILGMTIEYEGETIESSLKFIYIEDWYEKDC